MCTHALPLTAHAIAETIKHASPFTFRTIPTRTDSAMPRGKVWHYSRNFNVFFTLEKKKHILGRNCWDLNPRPLTL